MKTYERQTSAPSAASLGFNEEPTALSTNPLNCTSDESPDWKMLAIWAFVVLSFAALVAAVYLIRSKCDDPSPVQQAVMNNRV